jgi:hypothetical protein
MAAFRAAVAAGHATLDVVPIIYDSEAVFAAREAKRRDVLGEPGSPERAEQEFRDELALADGVRMILAVAEHEAAIFSAAHPADVRVLGYSAMTRPTTTPFAARNGFLFVGPTYHDGTPNADSMVWFIDEVLPEIVRAIGSSALTLVGYHHAPAVVARLGGDVRSLGPLADLDRAYSAARVFVAPTRFAAGIPLKVYDAAASGLPVVMTPLLASQPGWRHEEEALVGSSPQEFAAQCVRLHGDRVLWERIRSRALERVARDCDPARFNGIVADVLTLARRDGLARLLPGRG